MNVTAGSFEARMVAIEQEQSVLGALLRRNDAADLIGDLKEEHFFDQTHRAVFRATMKLIGENKPADIMTVHDALVVAGGFEVDLSYLNNLLQTMPSAANAGRYAQVVIDRAIKRALVEVAHEAIEIAHKSPADAVELVDAVSTKLELLGRATVQNEPELAADGLDSHLTAIDQRASGEMDLAISTGMEDLDRQLNGGFRRGNLIVLAARPKMGKTALAANIANYVAKDGIAALFSMEMSKSNLHDRNLASLGGIHLDHLLDPRKLTEDDWNSMTRAVLRLKSMKLYLDDQAALTLFQVAAKAKQIKRKAGGLDLLVIDYLQLMSATGGNRNAEIESITRGLKGLAKDLDIAILLLSQLNRKLEDRPNKRPQPADLRDSGSIEQDCDIAMFVYRDEVYNQDSPDKGTAEVNVALNRQGASGTVRLQYTGEHTKFHDLSHNWRPEIVEPVAPPRKKGF